jgi:MscS family membrane protein
MSDNNGFADRIFKLTGQENLAEFWRYVEEVWNTGFMGIDIGSVIVALIIFAAFLMLRGIFSKYILAKLHNFAGRTDTSLDDREIEALAPPIKFIPVVLGIFFAGQYLELDIIFGEFFGRIIRTLIAFTIFWALYRSLGPMSKISKRLENLLTPMMVSWMFKALKVAVIFLGGAVILEVWGIQVGPLLAGLGLFGAAIALGAQDLFKNLIGGLTIIAEKRFQPGEWIRVEGIVEGTVEDIGFRSTKVRRFDKAPVHVPNSQLSDAAIINFSRMTHRRIYWKVGVVYSTTIDQLRIIRDGITEFITSSDDFESPENVSTFVHVDTFSDSSIDIMVYCFTKTTNWGEWLEIKEKLAFSIKEIVEDKAGTSFAFPSTSIYLEKMPEESPETFLPPHQDS